MSDTSVYRCIGGAAVKKNSVSIAIAFVVFGALGAAGARADELTAAPRSSLHPRQIGGHGRACMSAPTADTGGSTQPSPTTPTIQRLRPGPAAAARVAVAAFRSPSTTLRAGLAAASSGTTSR